MSSAAIEAIVLAAGSSQRLGRPKALIEVEDTTALERILGVLTKCGVRSGVVVAGEHLHEMKSRVDPAPLQFALNPTPEAGRMGSVIIGIASTDPESDILLWPVDRPMARLDTVQGILSARAQEPGDDVVIVPEYDGHTGHPILIAQGLRAPLLSAAPDANLRDVLHSAGANRIKVSGDSGIHTNLDTEEDVREANR
jgi:CTP:molybdopterin cytidylyltransferase MocA